MARKSNRREAARVSATEASRSFSRLLDKVEAGRRFVVHRRGRDVCVIAPPPVLSRAASACLEILRGRAPVLLDDAFGRDLLRALREEKIEDRPSWNS